MNKHVLGWVESCPVGFSMEAGFDWMGLTTVGTATAEEDYLKNLSGNALLGDGVT